MESESNFSMDSLAESEWEKSLVQANSISKLLVCGAEKYFRSNAEGAYHYRKVLVGERFTLLHTRFPSSCVESMSKHLDRKLILREK